MSKYTTGEIAKMCGISVRTVQYYDTKNILVPTELSEGGRRLYSDNDLSKMKVICFLRDIGLPLAKINELIHETNSTEVISLILQEHKLMLRDEIKEKEHKLELLNKLQSILKKETAFSVESIGDAAQIMENKKSMRRLHITLLLTAIPFEIVEISSLILCINTGIWWPFLLYTAIEIFYAILISRFYFKRVAYICPQCHELFKPPLKKAFWASHTPSARKLTCPHCSYKGFCIEIYQKEEQ